MVEVIKENKFESEVLKAKGYVVVDFYADWCGPCKMMAPIFNEASKDVDAKFVKVDVEDSPMLASKLEVRSIPTIIIFKNGKEVDRIMGALPKPAFVQKLKSLMK